MLNYSGKYSDFSETIFYARNRGTLPVASFLCMYTINLWHQAKENAISAVNTELLDANWQTGKYIVEFEQGGKVRAEYGKQLLVNLAKDLTLQNGRGFSRSNLSYMRKFYLSFPKCETVSHKLTWSHYFEILKCDEPLEMQFYLKQCKMYPIANALRSQFFM